MVPVMRAIGIVLCLALALSLAGCTSHSGAGGEESVPAQTSAEEAPQEVLTEESEPAAESAVSVPEESPSSSQPLSDTPSPEWVLRLPQAEEAQQLFLVAATGEHSARVSLHQRGEDGRWWQILETEGRIGKNGLGKQREGDGKTPVGTFRFNRAFGIAEDPGSLIPYVRVDGNSYWSGDQREGMHYNELVDIRDLPDLDQEASEHIEDFWDQYQYCLNISYNAEGTPGLGSAIFLHCFGEYPYTGGCVAVEREQMPEIMRRVDEHCLVVIDSAENLGAETE
jgi:L,D-peptidoglycan transpeptidase YkuD (ErfK/YbiS/YcfS/YnhG family)